MTPAKPEKFTALLAPVGVEVKFVDFWRDRPLLPKAPRSFFVHTMAASVPTSVQSAWNHAYRAPNTNTCPTYALGLGGDARKMLPSNRRSIATSTVNEYERPEDAPYGDISWWSLSIETADRGYNLDPYPTGSYFTAPQIETLATIIAYEATTHGFPLVKLPVWHGAGVAGHTDPFGYPYTTLHRGKSCPGDRKKAQLWELVLPRAQAIVAAWFPPPPPSLPPLPPSEDEMPPVIIKAGPGGAAQGALALADAALKSKVWLRSEDLPPLRALYPEITLHGATFDAIPTAS